MKESKKVDDVITATRVMSWLAVLFPLAYFWYEFGFLVMFCIICITFGLNGLHATATHKDLFILRHREQKGEDF